MRPSSMSKRSKFRAERGSRTGKQKFIRSTVPLSNEGATVHDLELAMGWPAGRVSRHLAKKELRHDLKKMEEISKTQWNQMMRVIRDVVDDVSRILYPADPLRLCKDFASAFCSENNISMRRNLRELEKLKDTALEGKRKAKKNSVELRTIRALLSVCSRSFLLEQKECAISARGRSYQSGKQDLNLLLSGKSLDPKKKSNRRFDPAAVEHAVKFILSPSNVGILSWGTKNIHLDGRRYVIPALCRKKCPARIFEAYCSIADDSQKSVKRARFLEMINLFTAGETKLIRSVDYVTGILVNDNIETLKRIITHFGSSKLEKEQLNESLTLMKAFLKYQYDGHIKYESECPSHSISHALGLEISTIPVDEAPDCSACKFPFWVLERVKSLTKTEESGVREVLEDCQRKLQLYMGHRVRVINQQRAIKRVIDNMREHCERNKEPEDAIVVLDYKMKFEAMYFREKTIEHYGKRGISWHGAMLKYFAFDKDANGPVQQIHYFDSISFGDNLQDSSAVISILECLLMRIRRILPSMKRITLQSDNASCYMSQYVLMAVPILSLFHDIRVVRFLHTGTQDGKSSLDGHFATSTRWIREYLKEGNNALTASQLVEAMRSNGGLPNTIVELIRHDRGRLNEFLQSLNEIGSDFSKLRVKSFADINYHYADTVSDFSHFSEELTISSLPQFQVVCKSYSGAKGGTVLHVTPSLGCISIQNTESASLLEAECGEMTFGENDPSEEGDDESWQGDCKLEHQDREEENSEVELQDSSREEGDSGAVIGEENISDTGPVTGVTIMSESHILKMKRRWKRHGSRFRRELLLGTERQEINDFALSERKGRKDMISYAKRYVLRCLGEGSVDIRDARRDSAKDYKQCDGYELLSTVLWKVGWAKRPQSGDLYGKKFIGRFRDEIRAMFEEGAQKSVDKQSAATMYERLLQKYPKRFDLPKEGEVRTEIQRLLRLQKMGRDLYEPRAHKRGRKGMKSVYSSFLSEIMRENPRLKPREGLAMFHERFHEHRDAEDFPTEKQVKAKISSIKQQLKICE